MKELRSCGVSGCLRKYYCKGYCNAHYSELRKHGNIEYRRADPRSPRPDGLKMCPQCKQPKEHSEFHKNRTLKDGITGWCKVCCSSLQKEKYRTDPEWRKQIKEGRVEATYGLTPEAWAALFKEQGCVCAVCKNPETLNQSLSVDHDHETGKVRGLLCNNCNRGLGLLKDSVAVMSAAIEYLKMIR